MEFFDLKHAIGDKLGVAVTTYGTETFEYSLSSFKIQIQTTTFNNQQHPNLFKFPQGINPRFSHLNLYQTISTKKMY